MDVAGQDVAGDGRRHGSGDRRHARYCRYGSHSERKAENIETLYASFVTSVQRISLIITEIAGIEPTDEGLVLRERVPGVNAEKISAATEANLIVSAHIPEMLIDPDPMLTNSQ